MMKKREVGRAPVAVQRAENSQSGGRPLPVMPLYSKLIPLRTVVSMFVGSVFHHLYSNPTAGSVPAGQWLQSGGAVRSTHSAGRPQPPLLELLSHRQVATGVGSPTRVVLSTVAQ